MKKYYVFLFLVFFPFFVSAQIVSKTTMKENRSSKNDTCQYQWKLYKYSDGTYAAYSRSDKRITPNVPMMPYYVGGGLFKIKTDSTDEFGNYIISVYNEQGNNVFPESLSCIDIFHNGEHIFKLSRKNKDNETIWAAFDNNGNCLIPFDKAFTYVTYNPSRQCFLCKDAHETFFTYSKDGKDYAEGYLDLSTDEGLSEFNALIKGNSYPNAVAETTSTRENVVIIGRGDCVWKKVMNNGFVTLFSDTNSVVIPLSRGYNDIEFIQVEGHVGYFMTRRNGMVGICDIYGNEVLMPRYKSIAYSPIRGFSCSSESSRNSDIHVWLDINGRICDKKFKDGLSDYVEGSNTVRRQLYVCPTILGWGDLYKFNKYYENGIVWTDKISKSNGYTDIIIHRDGPYYAYDEEKNYYTYYVFKGKNVGIHELRKEKKIISVDRGYTGIKKILIPNSARINTYCYIVARDSLYGVCDINGKEIIEPKYLSILYDESRGFLKKGQYGWTPIGICLSSKGKAYKSTEGNLYQKYLKEADYQLEKNWYHSAVDNYSKALKYDQSGHAYFNYGVALYNGKHYKKARKAFRKAYGYAMGENNNKLASEAIRLEGLSDDMVKQESREFWSGVAQVGLVMLATAADVAIAAYTTPTYATPTYGIPTYSTATSQNYDQVFNQLMLQSIVQTNYQMAQQQQLFENMLNYSIQQVEQQNRAEYQQFVLTTGSQWSYEEYMQHKAEVWAATQQVDYPQNYSDPGGTYDNSGHEEIRRKNQEYFDNRYGEKDCTFCSVIGNGKCRTCNGKGVYTPSIGGYTVDCPNCIDGKCSHCGGTGKSYGLK